MTLMRPRPYEVEIIGDWSGFSMPSLPMTVLAAFLVSTVYALIPSGKWRTRGKWVVCGLLVITAASRLYLAQDHPTGILAGVVLGVATSLAAFRLLTPNAIYPVRYSRSRPAHLDVSGERGEAIVRALHDQLGVLVTDVAPFGLAGSGGSTPLRIRRQGGRPATEEESCIFGKLYAVTHLRSDRFYKLGRTLLYGRLEDETAFARVRRLVQYEDYILRRSPTPDCPGPAPLGIVEITPEREYLLVTEFIDGAPRRSGDAEVDDEIIDQGLRSSGGMWDIGHGAPRHQAGQPAGPRRHAVAHRLRVRRGAAQPVAPGGRPGQHDAGPGAADATPERVYRRARLQFSDEEIAEAFAATRGLTMPVPAAPDAAPAGRATCTPTSCACSRTGCRPCASSGCPGAAPASPSSPWRARSSPSRCRHRPRAHRCEAGRRAGRRSPCWHPRADRLRAGHHVADQ